MIEAFLAQGSTYASQIDYLINLVAWIVGFWFVLAQGLFFYLIIRHRAKPGVSSEYVTGEEEYPKKFISWAHWGVLACDVVILFFAIQTWYDIKQDLPAAQRTVRVIGQQWAWTFVHPGPDEKLDTADDIRLVDELHLEKGVLYHYLLESRDVLHSFSVPVFRLKQDAIPGRTITGWFEPTITGEYSVQCAEICGIGHGIMGARVFLDTSDQLAAFHANHLNHSAIQLAATSVGAAR
jgi:cytochrome c oxidase subunit 2